MKKQAWILLLFIYCNICDSQIYFNNRYDTYNSCNGAGPVEIKDNKYLTTEFACGGGFGPGISLRFSYYDLNGSILSGKTYNIGEGSYAAKSKNITLSNQRFLSAGCINKPNSRLIYLWWFNNNLDSLQFKEYGYTNAYNSINQLIKTSDNKLYMLGWIDSAGTNSDFLIIKTDTSGNEIWKKRLGTLDWDEYGATIDTIGDKLIVSGLKRSQTSSIGSGIVMCLDTAANIIWERPVITNATSSSPFIKSLRDGTFLLYYAIKTFNDGVNDYYKLKSEKVDVNNNTIWSKIYNTSGTGVDPASAMENNRGNIIITQNISIPVPGSMIPIVRGQINEITQNGDSLFSNQFSNQDSCQNYCTDIIHTEDGGYCISGFICSISYYGCYGSQDTWLIKLDSNLCTYPNCGYPTQISAKKNSTYDGIIYPNPSDGKITISSSGFIFESIEIYNFLGEKIWNHTYIGDNQIDLSHISKGIYSIKLISKKQEITKKLIIQ